MCFLENEEMYAMHVQILENVEVGSFCLGKNVVLLHKYKDYD